MSEDYPDEPSPDAEWQAEVIRRLEVIEEALQTLQEMVEQIAGKPLRP